MKIGISTAVQTGDDNWDRLKALVDLGYKHIEFYNKVTRLRTADVAALKKLKKHKNLTYSFHSMVQDLFCADKVIAEAEFWCLKGEIRLAALVGCRQLIFHISKKTELSSMEIKILNRLVGLANNAKLKLCLENNFSKGAFSGDYLMEVFDKVNGLRLCLDIGHLKIALDKRLLADLDKFLKAVKNRIVQLHISFNNGQQDQHAGPKATDTKFLKSIIKVVKNKNPLLLIETKDISQAAKTQKFLRKYV